MRILALTDRDQGMGRMLACRLVEAGAEAVLAGPGTPRAGELRHAAQAPLARQIRSGALGRLDAVLLLECGGRIICPADLVLLPLPILFYGVDTHLRHREHRWIARLSDASCLAQQAYADAFRRSGLQATWVPLAANPEVHHPVAGAPTHDLVFIGNVNPKLHTRRAELLGQLQERYSLLITSAPYADVARQLSYGRIAFNCSMAGELNLRVFETLSCGKCLVTDRAPGSGLEDLLRDGVHLALYDERNLSEVVDRVLRDPGLAAAIASRGRSEVLERHTWAHRARQLLGILERLQRGPRASAGKAVQTNGGLALRRGQDYVATRLRTLRRSPLRRARAGSSAEAGANHA